MTDPTPTIETHRDAIRETLADSGRDPADFELGLLGEWDHARLPVIIADPIQARLAARIPIYFAVLPGGELVSAFDRPFARIVREVFAEPSAADAPALAKLATIFGDFGQPVGYRTDFIQPGVADPKALPRTDADVHYRRDGAAHVIAFYTLQAMGPMHFDCEVRIDGDEVELRASMLPAPGVPAEAGQP